MSDELNPTIFPEADHDDYLSILDDRLIDSIWWDLNGKVAPDVIRQITIEVAAEFRDATITAYLPIFLHRLACERIRNMLTHGGDFPGNGSNRGKENQ